MANKHYHGLSDSGAAESDEVEVVLEDTPIVNDSKIEDIVVVDFSNYANTLNEQVEGEKAPGDDDYDDGKASDKDDDGNIDCDDIALVDTYPNDLMEIVHTGLLNAATISHPSTQVTKLHKDSQQSHTSPVISNINDEVPLVVNSNKPDEPNDLYDLSSMTAKLFPTLVNMLLHETHLSKETRILIAKAIKEKYRKSKDGPKRTAKRSCKPYPSNAHEMKYLLYGPPRAPGDVEVREDDQHRWRILPGDRLVVTISLNDPHRNSIMPGLFLRCFDNISISQCTDPRGGFNAGSPDKALVTRLSRRTELRNHTYWPNRTKTPFVSVTTHPSFIYELIDRFKERTAKTGLMKWTTTR
ncbi:hypothetical protein EYC84_004744 [Monilinia fructicola]|uniref:Uncharacterized protein n=1 Tax=Monilinia fructicola TaxID=38448 RepID=A0A5M9K1E3_MONFR|nr:hypothetical protein EYC84_004744 [Monilinia fructicola]